MDDDRFDALTRTLAGGGSRRGLMRGAAASAFAWLGLSQPAAHTASQVPSASEISFPVQPICTCPEGLVLCQGLCVNPQDCDQAPDASGTVAGEGRTLCPPQQQSCAPKDSVRSGATICVPCPTSMSLDENCNCACRNTGDTRCGIDCACPKVATCSCACPGPPCVRPRVQNADTCTCDCPVSCAPHLQHNDACQCVCANSCPPGKTQNSGSMGKGTPPFSCDCICPDHAPCTDGKTFDEDSCTCVCPKACPAGATRSPGTCDCVCETLTVPLDGRSVFSKLSTVPNRTYTIRVRGQGNMGYTDVWCRPKWWMRKRICSRTPQPVDAEYRSDPSNNTMLLDRCRTTDIGLSIDSSALTTKNPVSWGAYRPDHVYTTTIKGTGKPLGFNFHECAEFYGDNTGFLTVEILCDCPVVQCPAPKIQSADTCQCVCPDSPCPAPRVQFPDTCECDCPAQGPCPKGKVFDEKSCKCGCRPYGLCSGGKTWDEQTCSCICPAGQQLCKRECVVCPPGTTLNPETCVCACSNAICDGQCCAEGQICDTRTEPPVCCTPHTTCPLEGHCGFVSDNCGGALDLGPCPDEACHTGFCQPGDLCNACVYDEGRNGEQGPLCAAAGESCCGGVCCRSGQMCQNGVCCAPNETCPCARTCPPGQPLDPATCTCGCPKGMQRCQGQCIDCPGERCCLDSATCKCRCPECGANGVFDPATCGCVCAQVECPPNWGFDEASCTCVCSPSPCAPGSNWVFDQTRCSCVCQPTECPPNMAFNDSSCSCLCSAITCPPNWQIDEASCACVCVPVACPAGFQFDEASCSCVCLPPPCPPNYQMDMATCSCFCTEVGCAEGEVFDVGSCLCVPSDGSGEAEATA